MKFEILKKNNKKMIIVGGMITLVLVAAVTLTMTRAKYRTTQSVKLANGTVKYSASDLYIVAIKVSEDGTNYTDVTTIPTSGYELNTSKSSCTVNGTVDSSIGISYEQGHMIFDNLKKGAKCNLYFDKEPKTVDKFITSLNAKTTAPNFAISATTDEGVYVTSDSMYGGKTYYWRGAATTNHVIFGNFCWRIIRINGDNTIRLIYNGAVLAGNTCTGNGSYEGSIISTNNSKYDGNYNQSNYVGWTSSGTSQRTLSGADSTAKEKTDEWYNTNLLSYDSKIANGKFCNDRNVASGYSWAVNPSSKFNYAARSRMEGKVPSTGCPSGDVYTLKAGAITTDEVMYAGNAFVSNSAYYLYNGRNYWTMSPSYWSGSSAWMFNVSNDGDVISSRVTDYVASIRPVINLNSSITFSSGNGNQSDPYIVR